MRKCSIPGCSGRHEAQGFCVKHYLRLRRYGLPTRGGAPRRPKGQALEWLLEHVRHSGQRCLLWPFNISTHGYAKIWLDGKSQRASRVMCRLAHGEPPKAGKYEAAHMCGNRGCVNPLHLTWKTPKQNNADMVVHGTILHGTKNHAAKLTEDDVHKIRAMRDVSYAEIARQFSVSSAAIELIFRGRNWRWLKSPPSTKEAKT